MMNADEMFLSLIEKIFLPEALGETLTKNHCRRCDCDVNVWIYRDNDEAFGA